MWSQGELERRVGKLLDLWADKGGVRVTSRLPTGGHLRRSVAF